MEKLRAVFKCRLCGGFVITDMQEGREENPITINQLKAGGVRVDQFVLCNCPGFMTMAAAEKVTEVFKAYGVETTPLSELYGVADIYAVIKI